MTITGFLSFFRVNTTPNSGKKRRMDCLENSDLLDSAERLEIKETQGCY